MKSAVILAVGGLALAVATVWAKGNVVISQKGRVFHPGKIAVQRGDVVHIENDDTVLHHVYVETSEFNFDSGEQRPGQRVSIKFTKSGTFPVEESSELVAL